MQMRLPSCFICIFASQIVNKAELTKTGLSTCHLEQSKNSHKNCLSISNEIRLYIPCVLVSAIKKIIYFRK